ncbi:protein adenylyltransferase SelO [Paenibacillus montanisoli]|uniref:Protein nucleotidyltransferase YdiU n=1 Tax=Paenibacillus montanisoli TaxID=2081970 RepID=A0A328U471_9BACL|nr:YdiU family protein [Paenibacillus montanisoli]RAP76852.1 YdiU family protein [Paenibacillus montanisoli]
MSENHSKMEAGWRLDNSYARLPQTFYSLQNPAPSRAPELIALNEKLAAELGLRAEALREEDGIAIFAGNRVPEGATPLAQAYAGHQFGHFTMLGDGRALLIGEQLTPQGERVDIQLKGSGVTPYSRRGDGRAALGPMLREYIISEAMAALGIPTTRSLAVVTTGASIIRDTVQPGAILTRVAASHIRVGTFQYAASRGNIEELQALADYTIARHYPEEADDEQPYLRLLQAVIERQAKLIAKWQLAGFIHGVMNTDNMALSGETIDYGPCAFMDAYDPATVFSSIDSQGRYAYRNQPGIAAWNLARFAETLLPLLHETEAEAIRLAEEALAGFAEQFHHHWLTGMRGKLGIFGEEEEDEALVDDLLRLMQHHHADFTNTFRSLTFGKPEDTEMFGSTGFTEWHERWQARLGRQQETREASMQLMRSSNPAVIPRNHRVEAALEAAVSQEDYRVMERLLEALANPFAYAPEQDEYAALPEPSSCAYRTYCGT